MNNKEFDDIIKKKLESLDTKGNDTGSLMLVTTGQMAYERRHLMKKLIERSPDDLKRLPDICESHPLFRVYQGVIEDWEIV